MKRNIYQITFVIRIYFAGITSYIPSKINIFGYTEEEARKHFKEIITIGNADWDMIKTAITIQSIKQIY